jgi:hypothetical protein
MAPTSFALPLLLGTLLEGPIGYKAGEPPSAEPLPELHVQLFRALIVLDADLSSWMPIEAPEAIPSLREAARRLDLAGEVECWRNNVATELRWCREHYRLLADCPPLSDTERFPPREVGADAARLAGSYCRILTYRATLDPSSWEETEKELHRVKVACNRWSLLERARQKELYVKDRRLALRALRELDPDAYGAGYIPYPKPIGR